MKWYTIVEVVDITTGEIHERNVNINNWIKIRKTEKYEINNDNGTRKIRWECRPREKQCELELEDI